MEERGKLVGRMRTADFATKEGGKMTLNRIVERMCEAANRSWRAMIVDLALSVTGGQLIASVLPTTHAYAPRLRKAKQHTHKPDDDE
ncbi:hypothetical protein C0993_011271 [Termitomyces sp. T159_Od127]|nr:hypothetical protein C0993_011271 [Termitomyces sp. T159_Od127]